MKILISSSADDRTLAKEYTRGAVGLVEGGLELIGFPHSDIFTKLTSSNLARKLLQKVFPLRAHREISNQLLKMVDRHRPDVVWIFKGMEFMPSALERIREMGVGLVNYNADHPLEFFRSGSGNANVLNSITKYDLHLTYSREIHGQMIQAYPNIPCSVVPFGHSIDVAAFEQISQVSPEIPRVCFVGNADQLRAEFLKILSMAGIPIDLYGSGWKKYLKINDRLNISPQVLGMEYWRTLRRYRIQLNLFRPHNRNSHNMRSFEVPACGGVMLAPDTPEHREFFESGQEAFFFTDASDAIMKCKELLDYSSAQIEEVSRAARLRSETSEYYYHNRAEAALTLIRNQFEV